MDIEIKYINAFYFQQNTFVLYIYIYIVLSTEEKVYYLKIVSLLIICYSNNIITELIIYKSNFNKLIFLFMYQIIILLQLYIKIYNFNSLIINLLLQYNLILLIMKITRKLIPFHFIWKINRQAFCGTNKLIGYFMHEVSLKIEIDPKIVQFHEPSYNQTYSVILCMK